jgi:hypothetical protein
MPLQGHPGNMAVVLTAMGLYGCGWLGWRIRLSGDADEVAVAQDLHPKVGAANLVVQHQTTAVQLVEVPRLQMFAHS